MSGVLTFASAPSVEELAKYPMNDLGNGMRLMRLVGCQPVGEADSDWDHSAAVLLYVRHRGWCAFNGKFWDLAAGDEAARRFAHRVCAGLVGQMSAAVSMGVLAKDWMKFAIGAGSAGSTSAMLAQAQQYLSVDLADFDGDPMALNVVNGTLKFRREAGAAYVQFQPVHDPADRITRICEARWLPGAKAPLFEGHVAWCQTAPEMQRYTQKLLGYGMTGVTKEQLFVIFQGRGGDGKSTLINAVRAVAGTYGVAASIETFLDTGLRRGGDASPDLARLSGDSRLICTAEPPRGAKLAAAIIKVFTGGGTLLARELRQSIFEFPPVGKVFLECNSRPVINDTDDGIWRRIRILLFENQLARDQMDLDLPEKLKAERDGILAWLVEGVIAWMDEGLATPDAVTAALDDYRRGSNPFTEWVADRTIRDAAAWTSATALYADYKAWCDDNGVDRPMTQTTFGKALGDMQFIAKKDSAGKKVRRGIRLRTAADGGLGLEAGVSPGGPSPGFGLDPDPFGAPEFD